MERSDTYILNDVEVRTSGTTNADTNVVVAKVVPGELAAFLVEGSRKHEVTVVVILVHVLSRVSRTS